MEELLNKLIEKGWKPRWLEAKGFDGEMYYVELFEHYGNWTIFFDGVEYSLRELVSEESWLWQFVCENKLVSIKWYSYNEAYYDSNYEYRLIESALCNEKDLEKFLLDNIKVWK